MFFKKPKNIDDKTILKATIELRKGSAQAFHLLYQKYSHQIYRFCLRMLNDREMAEDAFQETFMRVYENRSSFTGDAFSPWLFAIARNTCLNELRKRKEKVEFNEEFMIPTLDKQQDVLVKDYIEQAIAKLPISLREAILLREYEDYSYQEIAEILEIELSLVKVRIHRARQLLKEMLQPMVKEIYESR